jgi:hypothetical protein
MGREMLELLYKGGIVWWINLLKAWLVVGDYTCPRRLQLHVRPQSR